jgi:hypothetical protein
MDGRHAHASLPGWWTAQSLEWTVLGYEATLCWVLGARLVHVWAWSNLVDEGCDLFDSLALRDSSTMKLFKSR